MFLIDTHYRGMLFAERYAAAPQAYAVQNKRTIFEGDPGRLDDRFVGDDDVLMRPNLPDDTLWHDLLPPRSGWVNVGCVWFGGGPQDLQTVFCADTEMARVLKIKAETSGLNTDLLGDKNCHVWPCPGLEGVLGACVAVATDRTIDYHPDFPAYRALDMLHVVRSSEPFDRLEVAGAGDDFRFAGPPAGQ